MGEIMTISFTIKPITEWLALCAACSFVLGIVLTYATMAALELGAMIFASIGTVAAVILLILAVGSML